MRFKLIGDHSEEHCGCKAVVDVLTDYLERTGKIAGPQEDYDVLVVNGEGSLHHNRRNGLIKLEAMREAQLRGKASFLVNSVWEKNGSWATPILQKAKNIVVRGRMSALDLSERHGVNSHISPDFSYFRSIDKNDITTTGADIVVTDLWGGDGFGFCWLNRSLSSEARVLDMTTLSWSHLVSYLSNSRILVTGRHHAMYAACKARTPFVAVRANCHKIEDLLYTIGSPIPICDSVGQIKHALQWAEKNPKEYERLFDWLDTQSLPDFLTDTRIKDSAIVRTYRTVSETTLARSAEARGDMLGAYQLWCKVALSSATSSDRHKLLVRAFKCICRMRQLAPAWAALLEITNTESELLHALTPILFDLIKDKRMWTLPHIGDHDDQDITNACHAAAETIHFAATGSHDSAGEAYSRAIELIAKAGADKALISAFASSIILGLRVHGAFRVKPVLEKAGRHLLGSTDFSILLACKYFALALDKATLDLLYDAASDSGKAELLKNMHFIRSNFDVAEKDSTAVYGRTGDPDLFCMALAVSLWLDAPDPENLALDSRVKDLFLAFRRSENDEAEFGVSEGEQCIPLIKRTLSWRKEFEAWIRSGVDLAIVGNSPCELGTNRGIAIDRHKDVLRFNDALLHKSATVDYGSKCTLLAVTKFTRDLTSVLNSVPLANYLLVNALLPFEKGFVEHPIAERIAAGGKTVFIPGNVVRELSSLGLQSVSLGLVVARYLKSLNSKLPRDAFFGFSFVDQLSSGRSHYFDSHQSFDVHDWQLERDVFDALFA